MFLTNAFYDEIYGIQEYLFSALAGIFLYLSLGSMFPILQDLVNHQSRKTSLIRLGFANLGFFTAMGLILPIVSENIIYIEDFPLERFPTPRHNCDVRKDSDQSNQTIVNLFSEKCDLIGDYLF